MEDDVKTAFRWIVSLLKDNNIPFMISGGFAARLYGSDRPLYDIDIEVPDTYFDKLAPLVKGKTIFGPARDKDETIDVFLLTLEYAGVRIDISGCESDKLFNQASQQWESCNTDINQAIEKDAYGLKVPVINKQALIEYKDKLRRLTDLEDIKMMTENNQK